MSTAPKGTTLRLLVPKDSAERVLSSLGPTAKLERRDLVLSGDRMTTDDIVKQIRDLSRLRDDILHSIRQFGVQRDPRGTVQTPGNLSGFLAEVREDLENGRSQYQELQSKIESLQRQLDAVEKQINILEEIGRAGFTSPETSGDAGSFSRILGRLPARKLAEAQRDLEGALKDQAVLATGARVKDFVYILVVAPRDKTSQALQTLLLHDFVQTEDPLSEGVDRDATLEALEAKRNSIQKELGKCKDEMKQFQTETQDHLNRIADMVQEAYMSLRGLLQLGEGSKASIAVAWLAKPVPPKTVNIVRSQGAILEME